MRVSHQVSKLLTVDATVNYAFTDKRGVGTSVITDVSTCWGRFCGPSDGRRSATDEELLNLAIDPLELESSESLSQVNPIKQAESVTNTRKAEMWSGNVALNFNLGKGWSFRTAGSYFTTNTRYYQFYYDGSKEAYRNGQTYGSTQMTRDVRWTNFNYLYI